MNFYNGKIYKIINDVNNLIYIGSTSRSLKKRFDRHIKCASENIFNWKLYYAMREIGIDHFSIELIEDYPCFDKQSLEYREYWYISLYNSINQKYGYNSNCCNIFKIKTIDDDIKWQKYNIKKFKFNIDIDIINQILNIDNLKINTYKKKYNYYLF